MKIGVYVGSFNPPHKGHTRIVNHLLDKNYLDKIIVIPTGNYWYKLDLIDINHRINMLKFYENENIIIDDKNNDIEYTYEILEKLSKEYKKENLYLIIGADNIINFDKWKNYKEVLEYNLIILNRDNISINKYLKNLNKNDKYQIINDLESIDLSSTLIRNKIKNADVKNILNYIDKNVYEYIKKIKLYES